MKYTDIKAPMKTIALIFAAIFLLTGCAGKETETGSHARAEADGVQIRPQFIEEVVTVSSNEPETVSSNEAVVTGPVKVKGIYVTGPAAGSSKIDTLIQLVEETELNAMVIDVKNDEGKITYRMDSGTVKELGSAVGYIPDIGELIRRCKERDIYLIARVVAFKDPFLAQAVPEYSIKTKSGEIFRDKSGLAWVNPYNKEVWEYLMEVAQQAVRDGFDEIQFDYIRFSTDLKSDELDFGPEAEGIGKTEIITEFTKYACEELKPSGAAVSADVYGTIIKNKVDQDIVGQNYGEMAAYLDYICPMVYPSHYGNGVFQIPVPDAEPYLTIYRAMEESAQVLEVLPEEERADVRAWLQGFTAKWVKGHIPYGPEQIRAQIKGAYKAGYEEWIIWNAASNYSREAFLTEEEAEEEKKGWDAEPEAGTVSGQEISN